MTAIDTLPETLRDNPLVNPPDLPYGAPAFDRIKIEHFMPALDWALAKAREEIEVIKTNDDLPTFENTIEALTFAGVDLGRVSAVINTFTGVKGTDTLRDLEPEIDSKLSSFGSDVSLDEVLFERVRAVYDARAGLGLTSEQSVLLEKTYKGYARNGALLDTAGKDRLRIIDEKLSQLSTTYGNNVTKAIAAYQRWVTDESELAGIPDTDKARFAKAAEKAGKPGQWLIKLSPPPTVIAEYAQNRALRQEIAAAQASVAYGGEFDNRPVIKDILALKYERAQMLGYPHHASFVLAERMAKDPQTVDLFLRQNLTTYKPAAQKFLDDVRAFAEQTDGLKDLQPWDVGYYARLMKEKTYQVDMEEIKQYFPLDRVLNGLRAHAEKFFNVEMRDVSDRYPVIHEGTKVYEIFDRAEQRTRGVFYADYFARNEQDDGGDKRGGAWMNDLRARGTVNGRDVIPLVTNDCNYPKPAGGKPTLLDLDQVRTIFHEFGHGVHALMAEGRYQSLNGTNVKWDFVELPSQFQENYVLEPEVLQTISGHWQTGTSLPADAIAKIREMDNFGVALFGLRQTFLGLLDQKYYTTDPAQISSPEELEDSVLTETSLFPRTAGLMSTRFSHIFGGGYSAGYYSYKWAEVLDADAFEKFRDEGLYNRAACAAFRTLLSKGGTEDPAHLYRAFRGRDPDPAALFRREGLVVDDRPKPGSVPTPDLPRPPRP